MSHALYQPVTDSIVSPGPSRSYFASIDAMTSSLPRSPPLFAPYQGLCARTSGETPPQAVRLPALQLPMFATAGSGAYQYCGTPWGQLMSCSPSFDPLPEM